MFTLTSPAGEAGVSTVAFPLAAAVLDLHGLVVSWNPAAEALFGWPAAVAVGRSIEELTGWADAAPIAEQLRAGVTPTVVAQLRRRDGMPLRAELAFGCIRNAVEEMTGSLLLCTDLTDSDSANEALRAHDLLMTETRKLAHVGSWDWKVGADEAGRSTEHYMIWGVDPDSSPPSVVFQRLHEDDRDAFESALQRSLDSGEPMKLVVRIRRADGDIRWIEAVAAPFHADGKVVGMVGTSEDVTSRELGKASQRESEARYKLIVETAREGIWLIDAAGVTTFANDRLADILGRRVDELLGMPVAALLDPEGQALVAASFAALAEGRPSRGDFLFQRPDGSPVWTTLSAAPIFEDGRRYTGALAMLTDVSESHQGEIDLEYSQERLAEAQKLALLGNWTLDIPSGAVTCSTRLYALLGVDPEVGLPTSERFLELVHPDDRAGGDLFLQRMRAGIEQVGEELRIITPQGNELWVVLRASPAAGPAGQVVQMHGTLQDISERKAAEGRLTHLGMHDKLTGLPNRSLFTDRLNHALAHRRGGVTVLLIDLDGFKAINDEFGHVAADGLLAILASRLSYAVRPSDTLARFGGDEFAVLLEEAPDHLPVEIAVRLLEALSVPVRVEGRSVTVSASIGIAVGSGASETADGLLRKADAAMYSAKGRGGARWEVFSAQMHGAVAARMALERDLNNVEPGSEMVLHYQPLIDLRDGRLSGFEALLRWNHPVRGVITPDEFIPVAEASGVIVPIGRWVLAEACRQLRAWQGERPGAPALTMNVNVSARQLADAHLVADVVQALDSSSLDPGLLTLEITETMIMADEDEVGRRLGELKGLGVRISVDDFGTGYSSIGHLERFPVDELKIDRSFVASLGRAGQDSVALGVLRLARSLHLDVVAEGIERVEQLAELRRAACNSGQGYYFAKPLDPTAIQVLLQDASPYPMPDSPTLILLVDDDAAGRASTARVLRSAGYGVVEAATGSDALRIAGHSRLDAAIVDVGLPKMTGFEVAERLGEISQGELPIFILTGTPVAVEDRVRGLNLGAEAYLTKPVAPQELIAVLAASLRSHGAASAARWTVTRQGTRPMVNAGKATDASASGNIQLHS